MDWYNTLLLVGISAVATGIGLVFQPNGSTLGMSVELLAESPFQSFLIPGILLFIIIGLASFFGVILSNPFLIFQTDRLVQYFL
ncbi:hypothetical protein P4654_01570 [Niallia taxi]|uniref:hypothetical protein n=1 Tax=Niallia taxi TaxID=2499688 RepID=UPI002E1E5590|nr:hypothetical protein [Niallia taxi]MED4120203.1 hypothetical protein [Niallia taxi]